MRVAHNDRHGILVEKNEVRSRAKMSPFFLVILHERFREAPYKMGAQKYLSAVVSQILECLDGLLDPCVILDFSVLAEWDI